MLWNYFRYCYVTLYCNELKVNNTALRLALLGWGKSNELAGPSHSDTVCIHRFMCIEVKSFWGGVKALNLRDSHAHIQMYIPQWRKVRGSQYNKIISNS